MHTILKVMMCDTASANVSIADGSFQKVVEGVSKMINPESTFFYTENGFRTAQFVFDLKDTSQIPSIAEPFFTELNAKVEFFPVMNSAELTRGLESWSKKSTSYQTMSS